MRLAGPSFSWLCPFPHYLALPDLRYIRKLVHQPGFWPKALAVNSEEAAEEVLRGISLKMLISQGDSHSWVMSSLTVQGLCLSLSNG